ncbi:major facilitator superfamily domain-containing protein [Mycena albidolilacea]|uniref:Major facilitator superfamily domain-containing protein n=1 Tax=Mycena albidolilacea TaxID=1033008 RepID=A0AAD7ENM8_9AGAR|nr:major facilitator superfamily domain-containing protein [Mycena albidolilacea]
MSHLSPTTEGPPNGSPNSISQFGPNEKEKGSSSGSQTAPETAEDFPHGLKLVVLMVALCLTVFLVALDNSIIATAIPKITEQFRSLDDVGWVRANSDQAISATQLLFGKFYTFLPVKSVFLAAISLFELGSLICGVAPNSKALIIGRAIAGLGSAGIFNGALIILFAAHAVPLAKRPMYIGLVGSMYGIANVSGPLMGGAFTDKVSWRWCFYMNLPIGGLTLFIIAFKTPKSADHKAPAVPLTLRQGIELFDPWGTLTFVPAIVSLLLALQWGGSKYAWKSGRIIALFVVFGVLIAAFIALQIRQGENATVPPRIFMKRSIWAAAWFSPALGASFFISVFYLPLWFQAIKGTSAVKSGIDNLPTLLSCVLSMTLCGVLVTTFGYYTLFFWLCTVVMTIGAGLISTFKPDTGHAHWIGYQVIYGFGVGCGMGAPLMVAQTILELKDVPVGTSIQVFAQNLACHRCLNLLPRTNDGGSLFISVAQNVFQNKFISGLASRVPEVPPAFIFAAGATNLKTAVDPKFLTAVLSVYNDALVTAFQVGVAMAAMSLVGALAMEWKSVKGKNLEMGMA